ncbi:MAG: T9SS type A sorting domain-containing protein [Bacteroidota bacterium]
MKSSLSLASFLILCLPAAAQWQTNGTAIGTGSNNQWKCEIAPGAAGDAYLAWSDATVSTTDYNIHLSRLRANGTVAWTQVICNATGNQETPQVIADGMGGAIVAWHDERGGAGSYSVYAQRIDSTGAALWATNGVQVTNVVATAMTKPRIAQDGYNGVFIVLDNPSDIYAQRLDQSGAVQWGVSGINLTAGITSTAQDDPQLVNDGNYGAIVTWDNNGNIQAQRINSAGIEQWGTAGTGIVVCNATGTQDIPQIAADGNGGAIIAWEDDRNGSTATAIFAQNIGSVGSPLWTLNGVQVGETGFDCRWRAPNTDGHNNAHIVADGAGNFYIIYETYLSSATDYNVLGRRIDGSNGSTLAAFPLSTSVIGDDTEARAVSDGNGNIIVTWDLQDTNNVTIHHIRTVTIGPNGSRSNDLYVCDGNAAGGGDRSLPAICVSGCFALYGWHDSRGTGTWDLYASSSQVLNAPIGSVPAAPSPVNGPGLVCADSVGQTFACASVPGANYYSWSFPSGWTINSGQGSTVVIAEAGTSGTISVYAINDCGTSTAATLVVTVPPNPTVSITNTPASCPTCCDGTATATASGGSPPYTYSWSNGPTGPGSTGLCAQCYTVWVTDANGCGTQDSTCVSFTVGMDVTGNAAAAFIYPNPARDFVYLVSGDNIFFVLSNTLGETIVYGELPQGKNKVDMRGLPKGIYFMRIQTGKDNINKVLIIE